MKDRISEITLVISCLFLGTTALTPVALCGEDVGRDKSQRVFEGESLRQIAFPIGGIGTGTVSLGGRGELRDWEIFNRPAKGSHLDYTFFAVWAKQMGKKPVVRILERAMMPPFKDEGGGLPEAQLSGLPRLREAEFRGEYPFASIRFRDSTLPVTAELEAWNPLIPLNVDDSALPVALFVWRFVNPTADSVRVSLAATISNPIGSRYTNVKSQQPGLGGNVNAYVGEAAMRGLLLSSQKVRNDDPNFGSMALATTWSDLDVQTRWYHGGWWDAPQMFWNDFADDGHIADVRDAVASAENESDVGSIVLHVTLAPHGSVDLPVILTWYFPNRENYWNREPEVRGAIMQNFAAGKFKDAWEVARYVTENRERLERETRAFHDALFGATLPGYVIDAVSSQISTLRTNVGILLKDGSFFGFEGNDDAYGCCPMNCTHVWNYEQTLAFLYPQLERSMRETDFLHNTLANGFMTFRSLIPLGDYCWRFKACADGQMGAIVRAYRDWKISGDTGWLRRLWPRMKLALEFAWRGCGDPPPKGLEWTKDQVRRPWDPDKNGVMEGEQHNTYDIEFYGPTTMTGTLYLAALKAASEMAEAMGEPDKMTEYRGIYEKGRRLYDQMLWSDDYYVQDVYVLKGLQVPAGLISPALQASQPSPQVSEKSTHPALDTVGITPKYQYGQGCLSDQLLGQYLAHIAGLGYVLNPDHVRTASQSVFRYNFRNPIGDFSNVQRVYALNDEAGLLLCSWPKGNRPALPFVYSDEVWTGIEYQVAAELVYDGRVDDGMAIVKAVRDRYDGRRRNPWDEEECGHHYARAMSNWAVLLALAGYHYDGVEHSVSFDPKLSGSDFGSFWSCGSGWGELKKQAGHAKLKVSYGTLQVRTLGLGHSESPVASAKVTLNGAAVAGRVAQPNGRVDVRLDDTAVLKAGDTLEVTY